ncbi:MAG: hypothetical protein UT55_C0019G0004 [Candidatus Peregrinibacteria bacterium GW2011_GWE2_39_6]|nr:MAG: hypothetical protein UT36_C0009G0017 [Candidatus Peregrinibacteria bacterium GW2011_GWF2_39_17]KKR26054.1 MAG: hypothetical protein UT55_C0019G0004 [Candidatus Peregrinibacteria bacterium GW2011_GWE2_39_6]
MGQNSEQTTTIIRPYQKKDWPAIYNLITDLQNHIA